MKATINYFGWIADVKGTHLEQIDHQFTHLDDLIEFIHTNPPGLANKNYRVSLNLTINSTVTELSEGDEIAFLPPFSGG